MKTLPNRELNRWTDEPQRHDFGIPDARGRAQGAIVHIGECVMEPTESAWAYDLPVGKAFRYQANGTRNGNRYGPMTGSHGIFATAAERDAAVERYLKQARKAAEKRAQPKG